MIKRLSIVTAAIFLPAQAGWSAQPSVPSTVPIVAPWPQVYDYSALDFTSVDEDSEFAVQADGIDPVLEEQVVDRLGTLFEATGDQSVRVHFINPENLLLNGSFEERTGDDLTYWSEEAVTTLNQYDSSQSVLGVGSAKLLHNPTSPNMTRLAQDFSITPNTDYAFETWCRTDSVGTGAYSEIYLIDSGGGLHGYYPTSVLSGTNSWTALRGSFNSGAYSKARLYVRLHGTTGNAWFDAPRVFRLEDPSTNLAGLDANLPLGLANIPTTLINSYNSYRRGLAAWQKDDLYLLYGTMPSAGQVDYYVISSGTRGRYYGAQTLKQLLEQTGPASGTVDLPYNFHILDYPDYSVRAMTYWRADPTAFFSSVTGPLSAAGKDRLDYLSNLKLNELILGSQHTIGYYNANTPTRQLFSWNQGTTSWSEKTDTPSLDYWNQYTELTDYLSGRFVETIFLQPFLWYASVMNYDLESFPEGTLCNQIPFQVGSSGVAAPLAYAPAINESDNLLVNGRFEQANDTATVRNQSPINLNNYRHIPTNSAVTLSSFSVPKYSNLDVNMWMKTAVSGSSAFTVSNTSSTGSYEKRPNTSEWANMRLPVVSNSTGTMAITFPSHASSTRAVDGIKVFQHNVVRNGGFEYFNTSTDAFEWSEDLGSFGTASQDTTTKHSGSSALKIVRTGAGFTRITQDFTSNPNQVHTATIWVKHSAPVGAYCEIYNLEGGSLVGDSYVPTRLVESSNTNWYKQEFTFTTNSAGTFRLYLRLHGSGTVWYDDVEIRPEKPLELFAESFESTVHEAAYWTPSGTGTWDTELSPTMSSDGLSSLKTTGLAKVSQGITGAARTEYQARVIYNPGSLTSSSAYTPTLEVKDSANSVRLTEALDTPDAFQPKWRPFQRTFTTTATTGATVALAARDAQAQYFDSVGVHKVNWAPNSSFEYTQATNNFNDWSEEATGVTQSTDAYSGSNSARLEPVSGQSIVRVSQDIDVVPYKDYYFEVMAKTTTTGYNAAYAEVYLVDGSGNLVTSTPTSLLTNQTNWTKLSATFNSRQYSKIRLYLRQHGTTGVSWFDDAKVFPYNYARNGSFEDYPFPTGAWTVSNATGVSSDTSNYTDGARSVKISDLASPVNSRRVLSQSFTVPPWTTLLLKFRVKYQNASNVMVRAELAGASTKASPESGTWDYQNYTNRVLVPTGTQGWSEQTIIFNSGRYDQVGCWLYVHPWKDGKEDGASWSGDFWFDDVEITPVPAYIADDALDYNIDQDKVFAQDAAGNALIEGTDYDLVQLGSPARFEIQRKAGGTLDVGEKIFVSWNQYPPISGASCPQNEKLYSLATRMFDSYHTHLGLTTFHVQHDDIGLMNLDGRSLSAGLTNSQQLAYSISRLKGCLPDDCDLTIWADSMDRFHFETVNGVYNTERYRSIDLATSDVRLMPWGYEVPGVSDHAENFRRLAEERGLNWVATAGANASGTASSSNWMTGATLNSRFHGVSWSTWGEAFVEGTADMLAFKGLLLVVEDTWNHDGYNSHPSSTTETDLLYDPDDMNNSLGDLLLSRRP